MGHEISSFDTNFSGNPRLVRLLNLVEEFGLTVLEDGVRANLRANGWMLGCAYTRIAEPLRY